MTASAVNADAAITAATVIGLTLKSEEQRVSDIERTLGGVS